MITPVETFAFDIFDRMMEKKNSASSNAVYTELGEWILSTDRFCLIIEQFNDDNVQAAHGRVKVPRLLNMCSVGYPCRTM